MSSEEADVVIIGGGPTGLGAGWRLKELGVKNWVLLEQASHCGGLASSFVDEAGFTWDLGGHVIFSHYEYYDHVLDDVVDDWNHHERESWVWMRDRFIPYPLQKNIWRLPKEDLQNCLEGLVDVARGDIADIIKERATKERLLQVKEDSNTGVTTVEGEGSSGGTFSGEVNFEDWLLQQFGEGLCDVFAFPYNFKVWAYPTKRMASNWVSERVSPVDLKATIRSVIQEKDSLSWGPNATFRFPAKGGTGAIWKNVASRLPSSSIRLGSNVTRIDLIKNEKISPTSTHQWTKRVLLSDGTHFDTANVISTMPLDLLVGIIHVEDDDESILAPLRAAASELLFSSSHIIGIGLEGQVPDHLKGKCWMYFPEDDCPFYRVTVFSHYAPEGNVPVPGEQWSLMCEVSESSVKAVDGDNVVQDTVEGLVNVGFLPKSVLDNERVEGDSTILSKWHIRLEHGYPTPFFGRDRVLQKIIPSLDDLGIYSRGRFGGWKYEVANQDHSFMQGVEVVDQALYGSPEPTFQTPNYVNSRKNALPDLPTTNSEDS